MEVTLTLTDLNSADFSNQSSPQGEQDMASSLPMSTLLRLLAGPGAFSDMLITSPANSWHRFRTEVSAFVDNAGTATTAPAGELITAIREGWQFNMTALAEILGITRATLYNWLKGKPVADPEILNRMQVLAATAEFWVEQVAQGQRDFLPDYMGPRADQESIRQAMHRQGVTGAELRELIVTRRDQYAQAYAKSKTILGDPPPVPTSSLSEGSRRLHRLWAKNAENLHRFQNSHE